MGTRSTIAMREENGYIGIGCHWDGYPSNNGKILLENYMDVAKVKALMALGDISSLKPEVAPSEGVAHSFDSPAVGVTVAYMRDRKETGCEALECATVGEIADRCDWPEYVYVFENGAWTYSSWRGSSKGVAYVGKPLTPEDCI